MSGFTRFGLGGPAAYLVDVQDAAALPHVVNTLREQKLPLLTLGGGSNLIVSDAGFDGAVLRFVGKRIARKGGITTAETGAVWQDVVDFHSDLGLTGMERMTGIPGWLGGAIYGNAGAYGQTIMDFVENVRVFDGLSVREVSNPDCRFAYRTSGFKSHKDWILLDAQLRLVEGDRLEIRQTAAEILATRNEKFPPTMKCAGSIFKNLLVAGLPEKALNSVPQGVMRAGKVPSAWFLEQVSSKGMKRGGIEVASYHANLIYNTGSGTAAEVCELIDELKARVLAAFDLQLEEEVQYVGFADRVSH
ncbi:UDP-N-acetylmuramate dehydrogenase [Bryobacter aggregatus]|uniref:UDP-N-acetylmuramate dehydrogenase n=1 Tax=Bryobacter aggregatus TaxID=360054 RepID=UPI001EE38F8F|nr:UDP-N-acetylmuramate dehydrogenase [Bryobacter aggregatus]